MNGRIIQVYDSKDRIVGTAQWLNLYGFEAKTPEGFSLDRPFDTITQATKALSQLVGNS